MNFEHQTVEKTEKRNRELKLALIKSNDFFVVLSKKNGYERVCFAEDVWKRMSVHCHRNRTEIYIKKNKDKDMEALP